MIDNAGTPAYPSSVSSYRKAYGNQADPSDPDFWMTGPACVDDSLNQCALTAVGSKGYTGFGGGDRPAGPAGPAPTPPPSPGAAPAPAAPAPYPAAPGPSPPPAGGAMCCYDAGCGGYGDPLLCNGADAWCSG